MIQTILIPKNFGLVNSVKWIHEHNYKFNKVKLENNYYRFRQNMPDKTKSYYSKTLPNGIILVMYD